MKIAKMITLVAVLVGAAVAMPVRADDIDSVMCGDGWVSFVPYTYATVDLSTVAFLLRESDIMQGRLISHLGIGFLHVRKGHGWGPEEDELKVPVETYRQIMQCLLAIPVHATSDQAVENPYKAELERLDAEIARRQQEQQTALDSGDTNPFAAEIARRQQLQQRASERGNSLWISCGEQFISLPMVIDGTRTGMLTIPKSDIVGVWYFSDQMHDKAKSRGDEMPFSIVVQVNTEGVGENGEVPISDLNYIPLLDCLDGGDRQALNQRGDIG